MAKIYEEYLVVKVSKLVREDAAEHEILTDDITASLEAVANELINDPSIVVEAARQAGK